MQTKFQLKTLNVLADVVGRQIWKVEVSEGQRTYFGVMHPVPKVTVTPLLSYVTSYFLYYLVTFSLHF
jgi:hypothetical protein